MCKREREGGEKAKRKIDIIEGEEKSENLVEQRD